jgi:hypothetical protein
MTTRGTALLLGVLLLLVAYLWLAEVEPRRHQARAPASTESAPLLTVPPGAVARVALEERGARLTAVRHDRQWVDERGRSWRGDAVNGLVDTLRSLRPVMVVESDPAEPSEYGLGPDAPRLEVSADDGKPVLALEVGETNPAATGVYARVAGRREVVLIGALVRWELDKLRDAAPAQ